MDRTRAGGDERGRCRLALLRVLLAARSEVRPGWLPGIGLVGIFLGLVVGCANPGPVRSPSLRLPALVTDLSAERVGDTVLLRWTTPTLTTDGAAITGPMTAQICRDASNEARVAGLPDCRVVHRVAVSPGRTTLTDTLTPALEADPVELVTYRVELYNSKERTAGYSADAAYVAAGLAPPMVEGLRVSNVEAGAELEWQRAGRASQAKADAGAGQDLVELDRLDLTAGEEHGAGQQQAGAPAARPAAKPVRAQKSGLARKAKPTKPPKAEGLPANETLLRVDESAERAHSGALHGAPAMEGALDTAVVPGHRYRYVVERVRTVTVAGHRLEIRSAPSAAVVVERKDVFPPHRPRGLEAVAGYEGSSFIDLSWEPDTEADLAGYLVERQAADQGASAAATSAAAGWTLLTSSPVVSPSFRDGAVEAGRRYRYRVVAVDASGNRSAASKVVEETAAGAP